MSFGDWAVIIETARAEEWKRLAQRNRLYERDESNERSPPWDDSAPDGQTSPEITTAIWPRYMHRKVTRAMRTRPMAGP